MESMDKYMPFLMEHLVTETNNLMTAAQLLEPLVRESTEMKYKDYFSIMNQSLYRLLRMVKHLKMIDTLKSSDQFISKTLVDLAEWCIKFCAEVEPFAAAAGVRFTCREVPRTLVMLCDKTLIEHMLLNLISNAIRSAGSGGEIGLRLTVAQNRATITIWDNGPKAAMPEEETGEDSLVLSESRGLGTGWDIVQLIAEIHGGTMIFGSGEERGNQAVVSLDAPPPPNDDVARSPNLESNGGFTVARMELSDVLPFKSFTLEEME